MSVKRIGFCCKWIDTPSQTNGIKPTDDAAKYTTGKTTLAWMNRQSRNTAEDKLWGLVKHNLSSTKLLIEKVGALNDNLRMVRISSDILPLFTQSDWGYFYSQTDVLKYMEQEFASIGKFARDNSVKLSFHPGQFTVLASENPAIVLNSIDEVEYHATMARMMGYGKHFQDLKINVHISGKAGPDGIRAAYTRLSPEARNCLTIENEENSWGLDDCLSIADIVPIVLDVHHNFIREGEYIAATDDKVKRVVESWRGVRPTMHYSQSREDYLVGHNEDVMPHLSTLLAEGYKKQKLRAHSDFMWNNAVNEWALTHLEWADIAVEAKAKNLASFKLAKLADSLRLF